MNSLYKALALSLFTGFSYYGFSLTEDQTSRQQRVAQENHELKHSQYEYLKRYLILAEKNKIVTTYRDLERIKTTGGGEEDPYDKAYRIYIQEASSLK